MEIRLFRQEDARETAKVIAQTLKASNRKDYSQKYIEDNIASHSADVLIERAKEGHMYVACDGEIVVGTGTISDLWGSLSESTLLTIFVLPEYHGKGIGRMLIDVLEQDEFFLRAKRIEVCASITACGFYEKCGYQYADGVKQLNDDGYYKMEKNRIVRDFEMKTLKNQEKEFITSMLFPYCENEKYILKIKYVNDKEFFLGVFDTYYKVFQYISRTDTRDKLSVYDDRYKVWAIARFSPDKEMVAQWMLDMNNDVVYHSINGEYIDKIKNSDFGTIYIFDDNKTDYYIYLGNLSDGSYKFIRITVAENNLFDMEYNVDAKKFSYMKTKEDNMPDIVFQTTSSLTNNPHIYFRWLLYWQSFSKWGSEKQNEYMEQIILNKTI